MIRLCTSIKKCLAFSAILAFALIPIVVATGDWTISPDWLLTGYPLPTASLIGYSTSLAGATSEFHCYWDAGKWEDPTITLSHYIFSFNNGGGWVNDTAVAFGGGNWANVSKTLPTTVGTIVSYRWYVNDSVGGIGDSGIQILTLTAINISFIQPSSSDYTTTTVPLELSFSLNGTLDTVTYNVKKNTFPRYYIYGSDQIYSGAVNITLSSYGRYVIYVNANSTEGGSGSASYSFTYSPVYAQSIDSSWMWQYLNNGDLIGFIIAAWTVDLGESFYVIISMILTLGLYIRLKNLPVMIAMWFCLGTIWIALIPVLSPIILLLYVFGFVALAFYLYGVSKY